MCCIYSNITSAGSLRGDFTFCRPQIEYPAEHNERIIEICQDWKIDCSSLHGEFLSPLQRCKLIMMISIKTCPHTHTYRKKKRKRPGHKWNWYVKKNSKSSKLSVLSPSVLFCFVLFFSTAFVRSFSSHPWRVRVSSSYSIVRTTSLQ